MNRKDPLKTNQMKKNSILGILLSLIGLFIISCSNNDDSILEGDVLSESPEAIAQFDNSNFGIYKGVFVGSSGTIVVNINNDNSVSANLVIDGTTYLFATNQIIQENLPTIINFTSGNNSFTFSVSLDGSNPQIYNVSIEGHPNATILLVKETSSMLVELFEGTYAGNDNNQELGTFNAVVSENVMIVLAYSSTYGVFYTAAGVINGQTISGLTSTGTSFTGNVNDDDMSGTWNNNQSNENGIWSATRTY